MVHGESEDSDHLYTPPGSDDEDEGMKYPTYKFGQGMEFQLGMMFTNKEMIRDAFNDHAMENQKNVFIKKNDSKRIMVKCIDGCKFYMRFSKRIGNQFWQVVTLIEDHTCHKTAGNRSAKKKWLSNKFASILRHSPFMKPSGLRAEAVERRGVKLSHDHAYRANRKAIDNGKHVFKRIYICLEACKVGFAKTCKRHIGLDACFLKVEYGGQLMAAVGRDGNNQNFPIGLVPAIQGISANVESRLCVKHLYGNWKKKHPGLELKEVL
ncbi:uncharacterized protein LOC127136857 [Lathyrus oleraceus]|uniref:uncharacterized protein LOC127136857 n=1 Tax=Pisum sativum TaxID=3888 RepID=UPI0021D02DD1|nr:uncharacterized protein LOC127136857 [Pisum sativum]